MSPVYRAGSVPRSLLTSLSFVKISMCSYGTRASPVTGISNFATEISVMGVEI